MDYEKATAYQSEAKFQQAVISWAREQGWLVYFTSDSRYSPPGFPDLVLTRGERTIFAELKTNQGQLRESQIVWLDELAKGPAEVYVWRPERIAEIFTTLMARSCTVDHQPHGSPSTA